MKGEDVAYDRSSVYLEPDQYVKLIDWEGNDAFYKISRDEPMGATRVQFANTGVELAAGGSTGPFDAEWLSPPRENRLYQIVPMFEFRWRGIPPNPNPDPTGGDDAERNYISLNDVQLGRCVDKKHIPCSLDLRIFHPSGSRRLGTGTAERIEVNTIDQTIGGLQPTIQTIDRADAVIPHYLMPLRDDFSHIWDMWTVFGAFPAFDIVNRSPISIGGDDFPVDANLVLLGRRYMLENVTQEELNGLRERDPKYPYRGITIGGVTQVTTRA